MKHGALLLLIAGLALTATLTQAQQQERLHPSQEHTPSTSSAQPRFVERRIDDQGADDDQGDDAGADDGGADDGGANEQDVGTEEGKIAGMEHGTDEHKDKTIIIDLPPGVGDKGGPYVRMTQPKGKNVFGKLDVWGRG